MWTRRKLFPTQQVPVTPQPAAVTTPFFTQQQRSTSADFTLDESAFNFVASLGYTLVPSLSPQEAAQLLAWALPQSWVSTGSASATTAQEEAYKKALVTLTRNPAVLKACSQVEYFFFGTDNGQVFLMPLLPPHLLDVLLSESALLLPGLQRQYEHEARLVRARWAAEAAPQQHVPVNCVGRRLLHRHAREEPVTAVDHLGVLCASASSCADDRGVALSLFHPMPAAVVCVAHPSPVRSLKLWEGAVFTTAADTTDALHASWGARVREAEPVAVYLLTGDDAGLVRLWRVDVVARTYCLQHVLLCSGNMTGMLSPLTPFAREDTTRRVPSREADRVLHCLEIDVAASRLFAGTEGGVYVWALDALPWRGPDDEAEPASPDTTTTTVTPASVALRHSLCWDADHQSPLPCALRGWADTDAAAAAPQREDVAADDADGGGAGVVAYRASRLVNHHVWIAEAAAVQSEMARAQAGGGAECVSGWKPKYGRVITGGAAVGVVSNNVRLDRGTTAASRLTNAVVTVTFDSGELKNDLRIPLSCVMPVVYPVAFLRTPNTACFAARVLAPQRRVLTSCADGKVCVWSRKAGEDAGSAETYVPQLITENRQEHRGLGRHLCVLRSPDVFVSCSYDDGLVKEWHVYDEPEVLLRCSRRFTLTPVAASSDAPSGGGPGNAKELAEMFKDMSRSAEREGKEATSSADKKNSHDDGSSSEEEDDDEKMLKAAEGGDVVAGISCAAAYPAFAALFLVGVFESVIQSYTLTEVVGCEPPRNFIYNGHKTVRLPGSMAEDVYHEME